VSSGVTRATIETLYRCHAPTVFRRALALLGSEADAHEVVQDVFLALFERPSQFEAKSALTTYLYSVTTHACLNRIHKQRNRQRLLRERELPGVERELDGSMTQEQRYQLHCTLVRMPELLARVMIHAFVDELKHEEIAELLGCSRRQVGRLLERASSWTRGEEERAW